jgi:hypothetical protein
MHVGSMGRKRGECIAAKGIIFSIARVEWPTDDGPIITVSNPRLEADDE